MNQQEVQGMKAQNGRLRRLIAAFILLASLAACAGGLAEESSLTEITRQWALVKDTQISPETERQSFRLLRLVMDGAFLRGPEDALGSRILAAAFPLLAGIPEEDVPLFASAYRLPKTLVEQAWWLSLKDALNAALRLEPPETRNPAGVLLGSLLNTPDAITAAADENLLLEAAGRYGLPLRFVRFLSPGSTQGGQATSRPTETHQPGQTATTPVPSPGNGPDNGPENGQLGPGGPNNGAGSPQKRR